MGISSASADLDIHTATIESDANMDILSKQRRTRLQDSQAEAHTFSHGRMARDQRTLTAAVPPLITWFPP